MAFGEGLGPSVEHWRTILTLCAGWDAWELDVAWSFRGMLFLGTHDDVIVVVILLR